VRVRRRRGGRHYRGVPHGNRPVDIVSRAQKGQGAEQKARIGDADVALTTAFSFISGWPHGVDSRPAAAIDGNAASVELRARANVVARVDVPYRDSEGISWDDVGAGLACGGAPRGASCVLIAVVVGNNANVDLTDVRVVVSAPFNLLAAPLDGATLTKACATPPPIVSVVADAELVITAGTRVAAALTIAGCRVRDVETSKAKRNGKSVVYFASTHAAVAKAIAEKSARRLSRSPGSRRRTSWSPWASDGRRVGASLRWCWRRVAGLP